MSEQLTEASEDARRLAEACAEAAVISVEERLYGYVYRLPSGAYRATSTKPHYFNGTLMAEYFGGTRRDV
jgi:hypothetical protein